LFLSIGGLACLQLNGLGAAQRALGALDLNLEGGWIDAIENVAFLDDRALLEHALDDDAGRTRTNLRDARRGDAARQVVGDRNILGLGGDHRDLRRRIGRSGLLVALAFLAAGKHKQGSHGCSQYRSVHPHFRFHAQRSAARPSSWEETPATAGNSEKSI
jgi:hypothetical protein